MIDRQSGGEMKKDPAHAQTPDKAKPAGVKTSTQTVDIESN